jgi:hypothetical protein
MYKNKPVDGATVSFHLVGGGLTSAVPAAQTDDDGTFTLQTGMKEGAPAGEYIVTVIWPKVVEPKGKPRIRMGEKPETVDRFKGAYASVDRSKIKLEVKSSSSMLPTINLE